jgi:hypothetical protein
MKSKYEKLKFYENKSNNKAKLSNSINYIEEIPYNDVQMDYWKTNPIKFAEECLGVKLFEYQKLLLRLMNLKDITRYVIPKIIGRQSELTLTTQYRLIMCISKAIEGEKVLIIDGGKKRLSMEDIISIINKNYYELKYKVKENIIYFSTGGSIELRGKVNYDTLL